MKPHQTSQPLKLGDLNIQDPHQRTITILGGKGAGKTNTLKMLATIPEKVFIFDPLGVIKIKGFQSVTITKAAIPQAAKQGTLFNQLKDKKVIFSFINMLQSEIAEWANGFFSTWHPTDCLIYIDEMHEFTPQNTKGGTYAAEVERAVRHWRNYKVGFLMTSQRPAKVDKDVLALTDYAVFLRTTWAHDLDAIEDIIKRTTGKQEAKVYISKIQTLEFLHGFAFDFMA